MHDPTASQPHFYLGQMHEFGYGVTKDLKSAFQHYRKAAKLDHVESLVKCGDFIYSGKGTPSFGEARGQIHEKRDRTEAYKCYKRASEFGSARGMNNLGLMLESGFDGIPPDPERAASYYKQAHQMGDIDASINLAFYYLNKSDHEHKDKIAKVLLKYAYSKGNQDAMDFMLD